MDILRVTARWAGFQGAPGYSNFHFTAEGGFWDGGLLGDDAQAAADAAAERVADAFGQIGSVLPDSVQISIESEAIIFDSDSGEALGFAEVDQDVIAASGDDGGYSGATGAVVNWRTNDYRFGRRIRGRTFLVPLGGSSYQDDGTLTSSALERLRTFGTRMLGSSGGPTFGVWSRPVGGAGGVFATATTANVPDMAAVLRSRRD